jgi:hypothetical protein
VASRNRAANGGRRPRVAGQRSFGGRRLVLSNKFLYFSLCFSGEDTVYTFWGRQKEATALRWGREGSTQVEMWLMGEQVRPESKAVTQMQKGAC